MIETLSARFIATLVVSSCALDSSHQNENVGSNEFIYIVSSEYGRIL